MFTLEIGLAIGSVLILFSIIMSKTGYRFGIPTLLIILLVGMLCGTDGLGLQFNDASGAQFIGMVALSVILFTGGLDTKIKDIKPVLPHGVLLSTLGVLLTTVLTGIFIYLLSGWNGVGMTLPLLTCMLLAATMSSTDSASVFSLLRSQRMNLKEHLRPMLELESGSNDPMAYMLTVMLIGIINSGTDGGGMGLWGHAGSLLVQFAVGALAGFALGKAAVWLINRINLPGSSLYPILLLSFIFIAFTLADTLRGNGYLAVYMAGIVVGNNKLVHRREINMFMNGMTWLFQIIMFLTLGLLVNPHEMLSVAPEALLIAIFMMLVARPASVLLCLLPFRHLSTKARLFISWVGLRGATPIIFATYPVLAGIEGADQLFNIVFFITLLSLLVQGMSIATAARRLKLDLPEEKTGNDFGVELPEEIDSILEDMTLDAAMLSHGNQLKDMNIPRGTLVMIVKRGTQFMVPNGTMELREGDKLLFIKEQNTAPTQSE